MRQLFVFYCLKLSVGNLALLQQGSLLLLLVVWLYFGKIEFGNINEWARATLNLLYGDTALSATIISSRIGCLKCLDLLLKFPNGLSL